MTFDLESNEMTKKSTNNIQIPAITSKVQEKKEPEVQKPETPVSSRVKSAIIRNKRITQWFSEPISKTQLTYFVEGNEEIINQQQQQPSHPPKSSACNLM